MGGTPDDALRRLNSTTQHDDTLRSDALGGVAAELRHPRPPTPRSASRSAATS
ncbi:hypothetical protein [Nonomuraea turcica]|uniref:hypothetical protein n=1 Tax=Nonomuraea sp. G32 TaxID=3067274 RepID=UPI00273CAAA1|nr:hypothetical protein [Nonomuraea sp. G32]MDP4507124.1 hypothetical protein [Nonomuraea sp. G32]